MLRVLHYREVFSVRSETFIYDLLGDLERSGRVDGWVLCHRRRLRFARPFPKVRIVRDGLLARLGARLRGTGSQPAVLSDPRATAAALDELRPDVIHAHMGASGARLVDIAGEIPLVVSFHGADVTALPRTDAVYRAALERLRARAPWCTTPTVWLAERLAALGFDRDRIRVVANAVHPSFMAAGEAGLVVPRQRLRVVHVGRFVDEKGQVDLIDAMALVSRSTEVSLTLVGYGPLLDDARRRARALGLGDRVRFTGFVAHARLPALLREHDLYVQPSRVGRDGRAESFGVAAVEALAAGLPVIVTDVGGLPSAIGGADGARRFVVPAGDTAALARAILDVPREMPPLPVRRAIDEHLATLAPAARTQSILALYDTALGQNRDAEDTLGTNPRAARHQRSASQMNACRGGNSVSSVVSVAASGASSRAAKRPAALR